MVPENRKNPVFSLCTVDSRHTSKAPMMARRYTSVQSLLAFSRLSTLYAGKIIKREEECEKRTGVRTESPHATGFPTRFSYQSADLASSLTEIAARRVHPCATETIAAEQLARQTRAPRRGIDASTPAPDRAIDRPPHAMKNIIFRYQFSQSKILTRENIQLA